MKKKVFFEPAAWTSALLVLYFSDVSGSFTICPIKLLGFNFCPGCGIGTAIHHALHLHFQQSFAAHYLGLPAIIIIVYSILKPFLSTLQSKRT
ncbi:MAG: DUF2752 domain-containing protein [Bacteroidota bacterium]